MSDAIGASKAPPGAATRFDDLVVPEIPILWRVAWALTGNSHDAEDLVQDTLVRAYRALDRFDGAHPRAWLLTILRNTNINRHRRRRPVLLPDGDLPETGGPGAHAASAEDEVTAVALDGRIEAALEQLSPKLRGVVMLVDIAACSYDEAADALGIPTGTVMSRLHRARRQLRDHLERHADRGDQP